MSDDWNKGDDLIGHEPPDGPSSRRWPWVGAVLCGLFVGFILRGFNQTQPTPIDPPSSAARSTPPEPPCIHQVCAERPAHLYCQGTESHACGHYRIAYEHHCDCDRWGTAPAQDGGL